MPLGQLKPGLLIKLFMTHVPVPRAMCHKSICIRRYHDHSSQSCNALGTVGAPWQQGLGDCWCNHP